MRNALRPFTLITLALACSISAQAANDKPVRLPEFAWRAALQTPNDAALVRVELPAPALGALQSHSYNDIRVYDNVGQALPLALLPTPASPPTETVGASVPALPLHQSSAQGDRMTARVEVRSSGQGGVQRLQMQWSSTADAHGGGALQAALFDLRNVQGDIAALDLDISLPDNSPVHVQASTSKTLQQWASPPTTGPLYRFAGDGAPRNTRLQFTSAQTLHGQFLLLQWPATASVQVNALRPQLVSTAPAPAVVEAQLPAGEPAPNGQGLEWTLPSGAHVQSVQWRLPAPNQLRTFQLQGRRASGPTGSPSPAWEPLGTVVVYHLVQEGAARHNTPHPLPPGAWKSLRLSDWPGGGTPAPETLQASMQLQPVRLAFLANGQAPYTLAVGRADTPAAALPLGTLTNASATPADSWPLATIGAAVNVPSSQAQRFGDRWRYFLEDSKARTGFLWIVLAAAVLALGAVALQLLRSAQKAAPADSASDAHKNPPAPGH